MATSVHGLVLARWEKLFDSGVSPLMDYVRTPNRLPNPYRYSVGPVLFPLGAAGETLMVIHPARHGRPSRDLAAMLWPVGFDPTRGSSSLTSET
jgi:hypothetical protein